MKRKALSASAALAAFFLISAAAAETNREPPHVLQITNCGSSPEIHKKLTEQLGFSFKFALVSETLPMGDEHVAMIHNVILFYHNEKEERWLLFRRVGDTACLLGSGSALVLPPGLLT
ncbi:MAG: hypothetical protein NZM07_11935 [Elioraea sp.]|nr:hypothetical protein [Elioraea sp.]